MSAATTSTTPDPQTTPSTQQTSATQTKTTSNADDTIVPEGYTKKGDLYECRGAKDPLVLNGIKVYAEKGSTIKYSKGNFEITGKINQIESGKTVLKDITDAQLQIVSNEIVMASFTAAEKGDYSFNYNAQDFKFSVDKGGKVYFNPRVNEIGGKDTSFDFTNANKETQSFKSSGNFAAKLENGRVSRAATDSGRIEFTDSSGKKYSAQDIYFDGKQDLSQTKGSAISINGNEILFKGMARLDGTESSKISYSGLSSDMLTKYDSEKNSFECAQGNAKITNTGKEFLLENGQIKTPTGEPSKDIKEMQLAYATKSTPSQNLAVYNDMDGVKIYAEKDGQTKAGIRDGQYITSYGIFATQESMANYGQQVLDNQRKILEDKISSVSNVLDTNYDALSPSERNALKYQLAALYAEGTTDFDDYGKEKYNQLQSLTKELAASPEYSSLALGLERNAQFNLGKYEDVYENLQESMKNAKDVATRTQVDADFARYYTDMRNPNADPPKAYTYLSDAVRSDPNNKVLKNAQRQMAIALFKYDGEIAQNMQEQAASSYETDQLVTSNDEYAEMWKALSPTNYKIGLTSAYLALGTDYMQNKEINFENFMKSQSENKRGDDYVSYLLGKKENGDYKYSFEEIINFKPRDYMEVLGVSSDKAIAIQSYVANTLQTNNGQFIKSGGAGKFSADFVNDLSFLDSWGVKALGGATSPLATTATLGPVALAPGSFGISAATGWRAITGASEITGGTTVSEALISGLASRSALANGAITSISEASAAMSNAGKSLLITKASFGSTAADLTVGAAGLAGDVGVGTAAGLAIQATVPGPAGEMLSMLVVPGQMKGLSKEGASLLSSELKQEARAGLKDIIPGTKLGEFSLVFEDASAAEKMLKNTKIFGAHTSDPMRVYQTGDMELLLTEIAGQDNALSAKFYSRNLANLDSVSGLTSAEARAEAFTASRMLDGPNGELNRVLFAQVTDDAAATAERLWEPILSRGAAQADAVSVKQLGVEGEKRVQVLYELMKLRFAEKTGMPVESMPNLQFGGPTAYSRMSHRMTIDSNQPMSEIVESLAEELGHSIRWVKNPIPFKPRTGEVSDEFVGWMSRELAYEDPYLRKFFVREPSISYEFNGKSFKELISGYSEEIRYLKGKKVEYTERLSEPDISLADKVDYGKRLKETEKDLIDEVRGFNHVIGYWSSGSLRITDLSAQDIRLLYETSGQNLVSKYIQPYIKYAK
ncbi:MAG: hypothetical protein WCK90_00085 [archaeon]